MNSFSKKKISNLSYRAQTWQAPASIERLVNKAQREE